jgi:hypothetical protein
MNNCPGRGPGPRRPWRRRARAAAVITAMAAAVLLMAACSSPSSTGSGSSPSGRGSANAGGSVLAYSRCMRSHGVPNFPDPDSSGRISKQLVQSALNAVGDSKFRAAASACTSLARGGVGKATVTAQQQQDYLRAAACMRSHGITAFPDPDFSNGTVNFNIPSSINTSSTQFTQARQICERLIPAGLPFSGGSGG